MVIYRVANLMTDHIVEKHILRKGRREIYLSIRKCKCGKRGGRRSKKRHRTLKRLVCIHRCAPIKQPCDNMTEQTYFRLVPGSTIKPPSGAVTIINSSKKGTLQVTLVTARQKENSVFDVGPNSSLTAVVANLVAIRALGKGESGIDCSGTLELDLQYLVNC